MQVLLGQGGATFLAEAPFAIGGLSPSILVAGDFDGDGRKDVAVLGIDPVTGAASIASHLGNEDGTYATSGVFRLGTLIPTAMVARDFNGDGRTDLVAAGIDPQQNECVLTLLANPDGTFRVATSMALGVASRPTSCSPWATSMATDALTWPSTVGRRRKRRDRGPDGPGRPASPRAPRLRDGPGAPSPRPRW